MTKEEHAEALDLAKAIDAFGQPSVLIGATDAKLLARAYIASREEVMAYSDAVSDLVANASVGSAGRAGYYGVRVRDELWHKLRALLARREE